jgi:CheY-like chemotaxis protein
MTLVPVAQVTFLIVDDHAFIRGIVAQHLKSCGMHRFSFAQDGKEAVQKLRQFSHVKMRYPALADPQPLAAGEESPIGVDFNSAHALCVITDFGMPIANGLELLKAIRCGETKMPRDVPVILLTGHSEDYVVAAAMLLDVSAFVLKPVSRDSLWQRIERVLKSEAPVKAMSAYAEVLVPHETQEKPSGSSRSQPAVAFEEVEEKITHWVTLGSVKSGAVLARDLRGESGTLLLGSGAVLSQSLLQRLQDVQRIHGLGKIPIFGE